MNNEEIDIALSKLELLRTPATTSIDILDLTRPLPDVLLQNPPSPVMMPLWFRHHWVLGVYSTKSTPHTLDVWDSAPSPIVQREILSFAATLAKRLQQDLQVKGRLAPRQPYGSRQCGVHIITRAIVTARGITAALPANPIADWDILRTIIPTTTSNRGGDCFTTAALIAAARPDVLHSLLNNRPIQPLNDADVKVQLLSAQKNHRFLVARAASNKAKPETWEWVIGTVKLQKRASTLLSGFNISTQTDRSDLTVPTNDHYVFACASLRPAPVTWDTTISKTAETSLAPTLRVGESLSQEDAAHSSTSTYDPDLEATKLTATSPEITPLTPPRSSINTQGTTTSNQSPPLTQEIPAPEPAQARDQIFNLLPGAHRESRWPTSSGGRGERKPNRARCC